MTPGHFWKWCMLIAGEFALAAFAAGMFWYQDWQYSLPTPRPAALVQPEFGSKLRILQPQSLEDLATNEDQRPTLLHFFNPGCPCSQFNVGHVRRLLRKFGDSVRVVAVIEADDPDSLDQFRELNLSCEVVLDEGGRIAEQAGVYATPQGVVLADDGELFFRGNYNRGRYCATPANEFVRRALEACLSNEPLPEFPEAATIAWGCGLPAPPAKSQETHGKVAAREAQ